MADVILTAIILSLPSMIALDKGKLKTATLIFLLVFTPIAFHIFFGATEDFEWAQLLFKVIFWLVGFKLALNCKRVNGIEF